MNCRQVSDLLPEYVDRTLRHVYQVEVERHIGECRECAELLSTYKQCIQELGSFPQVDPPAELAERIFENTVRPWQIGVWVERWLRLPLQVVVPAAAVLLVIALVPPFLRMETPASRSANKYVHRAWSYSLRLYGKAEGMGQEIATFKNIVVSILDRRVERVQEELESYRKQKNGNDQRTSLGGFQTCQVKSDSAEGASSHDVRVSPGS